MFNKKITQILFLFLISIVPCVAQKADQVFMIINKEPITYKDLNAFLALKRIGQKPLSYKSLSLDEKQFMKEQMVDEMLRYEFLSSRSLLPSDEEISEALLSIEKQNNMPKRSLPSFLSKQGVSLPAFKRQIASQIGWQKYIRARFGEQVSLTPDDLQREFQRVKEYHDSDRYFISMIYVIHENETKKHQIAKEIAHLGPGSLEKKLVDMKQKYPKSLSIRPLGWVEASKLPANLHDSLKKAPSLPRVYQSPASKSDNALVFYHVHKKLKAGESPMADILYDVLHLTCTFPLPAMEDDVKHSYEKLDYIRSHAQSERDIYTSAESHSDITVMSKKNVSLGHIAPPLASILKPLRMGDFSKPIPTPEGVIMIYVKKRRVITPPPPTLESVRSALEQEAFHRFSHKETIRLKEKAFIEKK